MDCAARDAGSSPTRHPFPELDTLSDLRRVGIRLRRGQRPPALQRRLLDRPLGRNPSGRYNKQILLPFGEYLPFSSWIPFLKEISPHTGDFTAGTEVATLDLPGGARFAPLVCYEDVPARIARAMTASGASVLLTVFNDAWFGDSMAPYQHEAIAVWRAIENRRYFVRVGNAGDTGVVDAWGRIVERLPLFVEGSIRAEIRLLDIETFYTRYGDAFAWVITAAALLFLFTARSEHDRPPRRS